MKVLRSMQAGVYQRDRHIGDRSSSFRVDLAPTVDGYHSAMKPVAQIRRERLAQLIRDDFKGNASALASHVDKDRRQISAWMKYKDMRDSTAREIEAACLKPLGWLDHENESGLKNQEQAGTGSQTVRTDRQKMADAIRLLQDLAELQGVPELVTDPTAISVAYDFLVEFDTPLSENNVLDITKRLAAKIRGESSAKPERSSAA